MSRIYIIAGTDTDVGKTVLAAALAGAIGAAYWKPIQCGLEGGGDGEVVRRLAGLPCERVLPEAYRLRTPASPHRAAEIDGTEIDVEQVARARPRGTDPGAIVIEGAGGLMVPLTRKALQIDLFARWGYPVILCARTALGTINHSLLSVAALQSRSIPIHGLAFIGDANEDSERTISEMGGVRRLGRLPFVEPLTREALAQAFAAHFRREDFV